MGEKMNKKKTMNLFEIYDYIEKLEKRLKRVERRLHKKKYK
jgi:hypothetical protein